MAELPRLAPVIQLPRFALAAPISSLPSAPRAHEPPPGDPGGRGWREGSRLFFAYPGVGLFSWDPALGEAEANPLPNVSEAHARHAYERQACPVFLAGLGERVIHASAVERPEGILALCAESGVGKSTAAFGLHRRGSPLWADDALVLREGEGGGVHAIRLPHTIRLRAPSAAHFGPSWARFVEEGGPEALAERPAEARPLRALVALERKTAGPPELERLGPGAALSYWLRHAYCFSLEAPEERRAFLEGYLAMAARVPLHRLRFRPSFEALDALLELLERAPLEP